MATAAPRRPRPPRNLAARTTARQRANTRLRYDIIGIALVALGLVLLVTMAIPGSHSGENVVGQAVVRGLRLLIGDGAWLFPLVLLALGGMVAVGKSRSLDNVGAALTLCIVLLGWWHHGNVTDRRELFSLVAVQEHGGYIGAGAAWIMRSLFGVIGAHILFLAIGAVALLYLTDVPLPSVLGPIERALGHGARTGGKAVTERARLAAQQARRRGPRDAGRAPERQPVREKPSLLARLAELSQRSVSTPRVSRDEPSTADAPTAPVLPTDRGEPIPVQPSLFPAGKTRREAPESPARSRAVEPAVDTPPPVVSGRFTLPPTSLLRAPAPQAADPSSGESQQKREVLIQTLEDFGIGADIAEIAHGPTITRYEIALERGIKVSKIVSLADNLAMSLAAIDVRVEAPIPGKSAIGIEVPNESPRTVTLRECLEAPEFRNAPSRLTFVLGKDVTGTVRVADLAKMPHLLIGGSTGSGKSVGINTLISSLLYRNTPRELKLLMIDPKKVELSLYDGIPHLASPVITNVKQAPSLFKQALREMETRYDKFSKVGTRNLEGYNAKVEEDERLPYWVIIVDELADLMMTSGPEIETSICRLAQLSRATGIHLVIATQRPSVNVITGTIKANISSRIAFAVNSAVDSRTILDGVGADRLIGRGDMLFMPMDAAKAMRIQGCFVSEQETEALVTHLKSQGQPHFEVLPSSLSAATGDDDSGESETDDDLFESAVRLVVTGGSASTSMLQRRFKIGYTRAARLIDLMEQRGIVGALDGAKPREIQMSRDDIDAMFTRRDEEPWNR
jgi:S-DNA-T family DNA segregation ATPase FtsK/SpoIIIE